MTKGSIGPLLIGSILVTGCQFPNKTELLSPTAPGTTSAASDSSPSSPSPSSSTGSNSSSSVFQGTWGSTTLPGLPPITSCTDLHWSISSPTQKSITGEVSATCGSVADITADLTGEMDGDDKINLIAKGYVFRAGKRKRASAAEFADAEVATCRTAVPTRFSAASATG